MTGRGIPTNHRISPRPINTLLCGNLSLQNVGARLWFRIALRLPSRRGAPNVAARLAAKAARKTQAEGIAAAAAAPCGLCPRAARLLAKLGLLLAANGFAPSARECVGAPRHAGL